MFDPKHLPLRVHLNHSIHDLNRGAAQYRWIRCHLFDTEQLVICFRLVLRNRGQPIFAPPLFGRLGQMSRVTAVPYNVFIRKLFQACSGDIYFSAEELLLYNATQHSTRLPKHGFLVNAESVKC